MEQLLEQLKKHEGFRSKPYYCTAGKLTIGYGRNLDDVGITKDEAEELLLNDVREAANDLIRNYPFTDNLDTVRFECLVNMCFNLGISRLSQFKKMWAAIEEKNFRKASEEMLDSKWAKQVGDRAHELSYQMLTGKYYK
jgi:lysozyme